MGRTVILIDDDPDDLDFLKEALIDLDERLHCFSFIYPEEAIQLLSSQMIIPDFIFLDINMPRKSGPECLREFRKIDSLRDVSITILSTSMPRSVASQLKDQGATHAFQKPTRVNEYAEILNEVISQQRD